MSSRPIRWINYAPTNFDPIAGIFPTEQSIRADLQKLREAGYSALLTYDTDGILLSIAGLAREIGFTYVGVGVFRPGDAASLDRAASIADCVSFYIVGSEGLARGDYSESVLIAAVKELQQRTGRPIATAEPWQTMLDHPAVISAVNIVGVNIHGWFEGAHTPQGAVQLLEQHYQQCKAATTKPLMVRETGFPSGGAADASACKQQEYAQLLRETDIPVVLFEAFDQPWKHEPDPGSNGADVGPHWGQFNSGRGIKNCGAAANVSIAFTNIPAKGSTADLRGRVVNGNALLHRVVVYIRVGSDAMWFVKPTLAAPLTSFAADGTWTCDITTGGMDEQATDIRAFVVESAYAPTLNDLPSAGEFVATVSAAR